MEDLRKTLKVAKRQHKVKATGLAGKNLTAIIETEVKVSVILKVLREKDKTENSVSY